jgi:hypothetical protein
MKDFIGVRHKWGTIICAESLQTLKRDALLFTRIAIPSLDGWMNWQGQQSTQTPSYFELKQLEEKGIIYDSLSDSSLDHSKLFQEHQLHLAEAMKLVKRFNEGDTQHLSLSAKEVLAWGAESLVVNEYLVRIVSAQLRDVYHTDSLPILFIDLPSSKETQIKRSDVMNIALNTLPVPSPLISWEQIIEYRSDPDSHSKFLALRHWMSEVARAELTPAEVEEKLEHLIDQYQKHMQLHRMKTNVGTLETIVTTTAEVLGDLASFKWGKAAEALFSLKKRKVALLEGELTAPGNEVAYIVKARETFTG